MICREWIWKGRTLVIRRRFSHVSHASSYEDKFGLYSQALHRSSLKGWTPRTQSKGNYILTILPFLLDPPLLSQLLFPFIQVFLSRSSPTCQFFLPLGQVLILSIYTPEWLGKAEQHGLEYGFVKRWAPHHGVGSFLPYTALVLSLSFSSGVFMRCWM